MAAMFLMAGIIKSTQPREKLVKSMPWVNDYSTQMVRFIGLAGLLGAIGLILPMLTGILPILTIMAALGLAVAMLLASFYHYGKKV